jgi:CRISPR system Cascade subunit CasB
MNMHTHKQLAEKRSEASFEWWRSLRPIDVNGRRLPGDRAALARLRRSSSALEAASEPATVKLFRKLGCNSPEHELGRVAALASVLASVRDDARAKVARAIGPHDGEDASKAVVKPSRLRRLLASRTDDDVLIQFRRVVALLGGTANVRDLAKLILAWDDTARGDLTRTFFLFDYYNAAEAAPSPHSAASQQR